MVWLLENLQGGESISLLEEKEYVLGRKNCDILIQNDQSISREHAKLRVKDGSVTLEDCKSRYQTLHNGTKLEPNVPVKLQHMDLIHFGILQSKFRFESHKFVVTASGLNLDNKASLKQHLQVCKGKYMEKWSFACTHLTVEKLTLTIKVLLALIHGKPIVTLDYWADYAKSIENQAPAPDIAKYNRPPVAEHLFSSDFEYAFDPRRKTLFENKVFIFLKTSTKKQLEDVIKSCGGSCFSWEEEPKTVLEINKSPFEHLLIRADSDDEENDLFQEVVKHLAKQKKRLIPINEIALAIVFCSCDVNCNPSFNKVSEVFAAPASKTQLGNVLAVETQTQAPHLKSLVVETERLIPGSFEDDWPAQVDATQNRNRHGNAISDVKRPRVEQIESQASKKPKLDNTNGFSQNHKRVPLSEFISVSKSNERSEEESARINSSAQSQSSVKRKVPENVDQCLKINPFGSILASSSKKSKTSLAANPFASFKASKPTRPENAKPSTSNPFSSIRGSSRLVPEIKIENDIESLPPVETGPVSAQNSILNNNTITVKELSMSLKWISKSSPSKHVVTAPEDPELLEISRVLKDCIQMITMPVYERPTVADEPDNPGGVRNFKKFQKVRPLRPQTNIISHHQMERVGPGDTTSITVNGNVSDDENRPSGSRSTPTRKPVGKRFIL